MTTVRQLKMAANAGEPDDVLALRIDVVGAAVAWYRCIPNFCKPGHIGELDDAEDKLERAVRRYLSALKRRKRS